MMSSGCQLCFNIRHSTENHPCSVCKGRGHLPNNCDQNPHILECELCGSSTHPTDEHICFSCNQTGLHRRRDCPQQPTDFGAGTCNFCKNRGHITQEHECLLCKVRGSHRTRDCKVYSQIGHRGKTMTLYQMRDNSSTLEILKNNALPVELGNFGNGIYLYENTDLACERCSSNKEAIVHVKVEVGRSLVIKRREDNIQYDLTYLRTRNSESLCVLGSSGYENAVWVIYDGDLVKEIYAIGKAIPTNKWPNAFQRLFRNSMNQFTI